VIITIIGIVSDTGQLQLARYVTRLGAIWNVPASSMTTEMQLDGARWFDHAIRLSRLELPFFYIPSS